MEVDAANFVSVRNVHTGHENRNDGNRKNSIDGLDQLTDFVPNVSIHQTWWSEAEQVPVQ